MPMKRSVIPWHVFVEAVKNQDPAASEAWLERWRFEDSGVWVGASSRVGRVPDLAHRENDPENFANLALPEIQLCAVNYEARPYK
jgi:hypothetical protein